MSIAGIEQHLIDRIKTRFGNRLKGVESLPADWDAETFKRILRLTPGVFVVFAGGQAEAGSTRLLGHWGVVAVTTHASGELARRRGDTREIGAYEIVEICIPLLHDHQVPDVGTLQFQGVENLFTGDLEKQGAAIYGADFLLPMAIEAPDGGGADPLDAFVTFHAEHDLAPTDGTSEAADTVALPQ